RAQDGAIHGNLVRLDRYQKVRFARRNHGAENLAPEAHIAGDGAAALAHSMELALFHVEARVQRHIGHDVGSREHALTAQTGDDDISYTVHSSSHIREYSLPPAGNRVWPR